MSGLGTQAETELLDLVLRGTAYPKLAVTRMSLHSADPGEAGGSELVNTAGSTYARQVCSFAAASGGQSQLSAPVTFTYLPAGPVPYLGLWTTAGEFRGSLASGFAGVLVFGASLLVPVDTIFEIVRKVD
jgi:hypothetical protein